MPNGMQIDRNITYFYGYALMCKQLSGIAAYHCCTLTVGSQQQWQQHYQCRLCPSGLEYGNCNCPGGQQIPRRLKICMLETQASQIYRRTFEADVKLGIYGKKTKSEMHTNTLQNGNFTLRPGGFEKPAVFLLCCRSQHCQPTPLMHFHEGADATRQTPARSAAATGKISS